MDGSPAEETGIQSGDVLVAVDGESIKGRNSKRSARRSGPKETYVDVTVLRTRKNGSSPSSAPSSRCRSLLGV